MKKLFLVSLACTVLIFTGCTLLSSNKNENVNQEPAWWSCTDDNCNNCTQKGGTFFAHSFGNNCEIKAKDADKKCTYNDECSNNICNYSTADSSSGKCANFRSTEGNKCTRVRGEDVACSTDVS